MESDSTYDKCRMSDNGDVRMESQPYTCVVIWYIVPSNLSYMIDSRQKLQHSLQHSHAVISIYRADILNFERKLVTATAGSVMLTILT